MPSTTVTLTADGETWTHSAYALGFEAESGKRAELAGFVDDALGLLDDGDAEPYAPERIRLNATELTGEATDGVPADWPADVDLAAVVSCTVVDDPGAVAAVAAALEGADHGTVFRQGARVWSVAAATVLPGDDEPCAGW